MADPPAQHQRNPHRLAHMDALKDRVGGFFTECTVTMACPVLLAVATKKVDLSKEGNAAVRHSVPWLAAISLFLCPVAFISLSIASVLKIMLALQDEDHPVKLWALGCTKFLVHASAIAQMGLALVIYLLITMNSQGEPSRLILAIAIPCLVVVVVVSFIWSVIKRTIINPERAVENWEAARRPAAGGPHLDWWGKNLQLSQELSAVVTSLLFVGLEGLALEGQISGVGKQLTPSLEKPVLAAFICCLIASVVTLLATVPPIDRTGDDEKRGRNVFARAFMHVVCALLALALISVMAVVIAFLTSNNQKDQAVPIKAYVIFFPPAVLFLLWLYFIYDTNGRDVDKDSELKPASLELTKVAFGACLAISLPSFRGGGGDGHIVSNSTWCFIVTAAMFVSFGLGWRFFSHFNQNACIWTSKLACVCTNLCLAAAAIELLCMAMHS